MSKMTEEELVRALHQVFVLGASYYIVHDILSVGSKKVFQALVELADQTPNFYLYIGNNITLKVLVLVTSNEPFQKMSIDSVFGLGREEAVEIVENDRRLLTEEQYLQAMALIKARFGDSA